MPATSRRLYILLIQGIIFCLLDLSGRPFVLKVWTNSN